MGGVGDACDEDIDGDGVLNGDDGCPGDALKALPGACGCGVVDDPDGNGVSNCDACDADADADADADGHPDCTDNCPGDANPEQANSDQAPSACILRPTGASMAVTFDEGAACDVVPLGLVDIFDSCEVNPEAGESCLCALRPTGAAFCAAVGGAVGWDCALGSDGERCDCTGAAAEICVAGVPGACQDPAAIGCVFQAAAGDALGNACDEDDDDDGTPDAQEECAIDPSKLLPGRCGCGVPDPVGDCPDPCAVDRDGDGWVDCDDDCPDVPDPSQTDSDAGNECAFEPTLGAEVPVPLPDDVPDCSELPAEVYPGLFTECRPYAGGGVCVCALADMSEQLCATLGALSGWDCVEDDLACTCVLSSRAACVAGAEGPCAAPDAATCDFFLSDAGDGLGDACDDDDDDDGVADAVDGCPTDPGKVTPGQCGCFQAETDSDGDGTADCDDDCAGLMDSDEDGDGVSSCIDLCPDDPDSTVPDCCGCGVAGDPTDTDSDGWPDCSDNCPDHFNPDQADADSRGGCIFPFTTSDTSMVFFGGPSWCEATTLPDQFDDCAFVNDGGVPTCACTLAVVDDFVCAAYGLAHGFRCTLSPGRGCFCETSSCRVAPACGVPAAAGVPYFHFEDEDGQGDACDDDDDEDDVVDEDDGCPTDPGKTEPGACGCGVPDTDADGDGVIDCVDNCPRVANPEQADADEVVETCAISPIAGVQLPMNFGGVGCDEVPP